MERDDDIERSWFSDEEESEKKTSLVDYDNSDSDPETDKDQKNTETNDIPPTIEPGMLLSML